MNNYTNSDEHEELIKRGLKYYDDRNYDEALPFLEQAYKIAPKCICARYNYANVLHMLSRDEEAYEILLEIIDTTPEDAKKNCPDVFNPRGFIIDAHYLIFLVMIYGQGFSEEAFRFASKHLELRTIGINSVWPKKQVVSEINSFRKEWKDEA